MQKIFNKIPKNVLILAGVLATLALAMVVGLLIILFTPVQIFSLTGESPAVAGKYTLDELASHNTKDDCYVAYNNEVFNLTWFVPNHKGGEVIIQECGNEVDEFSKIHPGGSFTKLSIQLVLKASKVGTLAK